MGKEKVYYRKIDYLRIISCLAVLLYHLNLLKGGFLAVCTFFVISGYLTCCSALKNKEFSIKSYYINRIKKIYIPLIVIIFSTLIIFKIGSNINWMNLKQETNSALFGYNNYWQLNANLDYFTRNVNSPFMHLWYISILMQFELIFPIIFVAFKKLNKKIKKDFSTLIIILLAIGSTVLFFCMSKSQDKMVVYYDTFARCFSIIWGILLALLHYKYNFKIARIFRGFNKIIYWIYIAILICLCILVSAESENYAIFMILATIISVRIIEYATMRSDKRLKNNKAVDLMAKISYEIYLVQYPVIFFVQNMAINNDFKIPIIIILTFVISTVIHLLLDLKNKNKIKKLLKIIVISLIIVIGSYIVITEKDYSDEMKELENKLNQNAQTNEIQNNEYLNSIEQNDEKNKKEEKENNKEQENKNTTNNASNKSKETVSVVENEQEAKDRIAEEVRQLPIICVGDSVLLGVAEEMHERFPNCYVDGKVSRTIVGGKEVLMDLESQGKLSNTLVLALANNGDYIERRNKDLMEALGNREIYWVNAMGADDPEFNERFEEFAKDYPNLHIVDWESIAKQHPEYIYADGVHIKGAGMKAYVDTVYDAIFNVYWKKHLDE